MKCPSLFFLFLCLELLEDPPHLLLFKGLLRWRGRPRVPTEGATIIPLSYKVLNEDRVIAMGAFNIKAASQMRLLGILSLVIGPGHLLAFFQGLLQLFTLLKSEVVDILPQSIEGRVREVRRGRQWRPGKCLPYFLQQTLYRVELALDRVLSHSIIAPAGSVVPWWG